MVRCMGVVYIGGNIIVIRFDLAGNKPRGSYMDF